MSPEQADGLACVLCAQHHGTEGMVPTGQRSPSGAQLFAHARCVRRAELAARGTDPAYWPELRGVLGEPMPFEPDDPTRADSYETDDENPMHVGRMASPAEELADAQAAALIALALCDEHESRLRELAELAVCLEGFARSSARMSRQVGDYEAGRSSAFELAALELRRVLTRPARPNADDGEE